jgi:uncharacterized repeat protein (TIGR01451 family)
MIGMRAALAYVILLMPLNLSIVSALMITKTAPNKTVAQGDNVSFIFNVTNTGEVALPTVRVVDILPTGLQYRWDNSTPRRVASGNIMTWENAGSLAAWISKYIKLWAEVVL